MNSRRGAIAAAKIARNKSSIGTECTDSVNELGISKEERSRRLFDVALVSVLPGRL